MQVSNVDKKSIDGEQTVELCNYTDVYYQTEITRDLEFMRATATAQQIRNFGLRAGDVIITKDSETAADIGVAAYVPKTLPGVVCGYHLALIRPQPNINSRFLFWAVQSDAVREQWAVSASGVTRFGLNYDAMRSTEIPLPPVEEQRRIANYLDDQTTRIDQTIQLRQKQVALLDEKLRSTGESLALGRQPEQVVSRAEGPVVQVGGGWKTRRNKTFMKEVVDLSPSGVEEMLTVSHITGVTPRSEKTVYMFEAESTEGYKRVRQGDLVINTLWAWMGALGIARSEGIVSPAYGVYRFTDPRAVPEYFDILFRTKAFVTEMTRHSRGVWSSRLRLYPESFLSLTSPFPPNESQRQIAETVGVLAGGVTASCRKLQRSIDLLTARRQSLITAAVTGGLDVSSASSRDVDVVVSGVGGGV